MTIKALFLPVLLASATFAAPAIAGQTITLPNGASANYEGTSAPVFASTTGPSGDFISAYDSGLDATFHYSATGQWLGVSGAGAANVPNAPAVPTEVTLPANTANPNGLTLPYAGQGIPQVFVDPQGNYIIIDAVDGTAQGLDAQGSFLGSGSLPASTPLSGSSGFGASGGATSTTTGGSTGSSSFGGSTSGGTSSGQTSGGTTSGGGSTGGGSTGGGTDVPAPAVFGLFGIAAGGLALARRRRRKAA